MTITKNINLHNYRIDESFAEFYGVLIGDGCISKYLNQRNLQYEIRIDGNSITDLDYYNTFLLNLIYKATCVFPKVRFRNDCNGIYIKFRSKSLAFFLNTELQFPFGKKNENQLLISKKILNDASLLRKTLRGLFDTDGSLYFTRNDFNKIRRYPILEISTHNPLLLSQLKEILDSMEFITKIRHYEDAIKLHGKKNLLRWFEFIGSDHPDKNSKFLFWRKFGYCPKIDELDYSHRIKALSGP